MPHLKIRNYQVKNNMPDIECSQGVWYKDKGGRKDSYIYFEVVLDDDCGQVFFPVKTQLSCFLERSQHPSHPRLLQLDPRSRPIIGRDSPAIYYVHYTDISKNYAGEVTYDSFNYNVFI